jgi:hypothetical protein
MRKVMVQARGVEQWLAELEKGTGEEDGGRGWWREGPIHVAGSRS